MTKVVVAESNMTADAGPGKPLTAPSGEPLTGGETAARAGLMVGGGASPDFDEQPVVTSENTSAAAPRDRSASPRREWGSGTGKGFRSRERSGANNYRQLGKYIPVDQLLLVLT